MLQIKRKRRPKPTSYDLHYVSVQEPAPLRGFEPRQGLQGLFLLMSGFPWLGVSRCGTPGREEVLYPVVEIWVLLDL